MSVKVDIVIVNWNSGTHLARALAAAADAGAAQFANVVVVDNASHDGSLDVYGVSQRLPLQAVVNPTNLGFAAACNIGAAAGNAPFILFHNPDVELRVGTLERALMFLQDGLASRTAIVGVALVDQSGNVQRCTSRFPTPAMIAGQALGLDRLGLLRPVKSTDWDHNETRTVNQIMGAFLLIRRDVFEEIGGFDERFFVYYDDVDLCFRAWKAGWQAVYLSEVSAFHAGQGTTHSVKDVRLFYLLRSRLLYALKHFGLTGNVLVWVATLLIEPIARCAQLILKRSEWSEYKALARGYALLYRTLPQLTRDARRPASPQA